MPWKKGIRLRALLSRQHYEVEGGWVTQLPWKESTELTISYIVSKFESPSSYAARDIAVHTCEQNSFYFTFTHSC